MFGNRPINITQSISEQVPHALFNHCLFVAYQSGSGPRQKHDWDDHNHDQQHDGFAYHDCDCTGTGYQWKLAPLRQPAMQNQPAPPCGAGRG